MPSEDFLGPIDLATLLTSLKGSVPASFAAYHSELNPGEDEALRAKYGPANFYQHMGTAIPQRNYRAPNPYAAQAKAIADMQEFRMRFPTPEMQKAVIESMNRYAGGGLRKSVQEMAEELLKKGVKTEDKPDLGRRSLLGMGSIMPPKGFSMSFHGDLDKAPKVVQKTTEIVPGGQKSTIESLAQTPTSRRQILSSAASQAVRGALPELGQLGELGKVVEPAVDLSQMSVPAIITHAVRMGMSPEDTASLIKHVAPHVPEEHVHALHSIISDPFSKTFESPVGPGQALNEMLGVQGSPMAARGAMRGIGAADPDKLLELKNAARDVAEFGFED